MVLPSLDLCFSGCVSVVVPPPAWVGSSLSPAFLSSVAALSPPAPSLARPGRNLLAKRLGKDARRLERRTEKEPPVSAGSSRLCDDSDQQFVLSGKEESLLSSGLRTEELGGQAGADLFIRPEGAGATPLVGLWERV